LVSSFPAMMVQLPLNLSLQNQNIENTAVLLSKQIKYGRVLGETEVMLSNISTNAERIVQSSILSGDYKTMQNLLKELVRSRPTDQLVGLALVANLYSNGPLDDIYSGSLDLVSLKNTIYERFGEVWKRQNKGTTINQEANSCSTLGDLPPSLGFNSLSPVVSNLARVSSGIALIFGEYVEKKAGISVLSSPSVLMPGQKEYELEFGRMIKHDGELRLHVFSKPGTILELEGFTSGSLSVDMKNLELLLKHGFFIEKGRVLMTQPNETILLFSGSIKEGGASNVRVVVTSGLARGLQLSCG
jgi:hypothetical protein